MIRKHVLTSVIFTLTAVFALQCGDDGNDKDNDTSDTADSETDSDTGNTEDSDSESAGTDDTVAGTLQIPEEFDCTPVLFAPLYFSNPENNAPDQFGDVISSPEIEAGGTFEFTSTQAGLEGDFYLTVVVYCEGGGNGQVPKSGVDWVGQSPQLTLGPGTGEVDAGEIQLIVMP